MTLSTSDAILALADSAVLRACNWSSIDALARLESEPPELAMKNLDSFSANVSSVMVSFRWFNWFRKSTRGLGNDIKLVFSVNAS